jgi:cytochrome c551/c552
MRRKKEAMKKMSLIATCAAGLLLSGAVWATETETTEAVESPETTVDMDMLTLLKNSACLNCHDITVQEKPKKENTAVGLPFGPPYILIAKRYAGNEAAFEELVYTVLHGSNPYGKHWKEEAAGIAMPPMVTVSEENVRTLLTWVLSLDDASAEAAQAAVNTPSK